MRETCHVTRTIPQWFLATWLALLQMIPWLCLPAEKNHLKMCTYFLAAFLIWHSENSNNQMITISFMSATRKRCGMPRSQYCRRWPSETSVTTMTASKMRDPSGSQRRVLTGHSLITSFRVSLCHPKVKNSWNLWSSNCAIWSRLRISRVGNYSDHLHL